MLTQRDRTVDLPPLRVIERSKVEGYLLHPVSGRGKAAFFEAFGFTQAQWEVLRDALLEHAERGVVTDSVVSRWGTRYSVRGALNTPDLRQPSPSIVSVWQSDPATGAVRLITAYPD